MHEILNSKSIFTFLHFLIPEIKYFYKMEKRSFIKKILVTSQPGQPSN